MTTIVLATMLALVIGLTLGFLIGMIRTATTSALMIAMWVGQGWIRFNGKGFAIIRIKGEFDTDDALVDFLESSHKGSKQ